MEKKEKKIANKPKNPMWKREKKKKRKKDEEDQTRPSVKGKRKEEEEEEEEEEDQCERKKKKKKPVWKENSSNPVKKKIKSCGCCSNRGSLSVCLITKMPLETENT